MFAPLPHGASDSTADSCRNHPDGDALPFPLLCATPPSSQDHLQPSIHRLWFIYQWYSVVTNAQFANLPKRTIRSEKRHGMERIGSSRRMAHSCTTQERLHYTRLSRPNALVKRRLPNA